MSLNDGVWIIYKAVNESSENPGIIEFAISKGESINDLFVAPDDNPIDTSTIMVYVDSDLCSVSPNKGASSDFYIEDSNIVSNKEIPPGSSLAIAYLTDMSTYFKEE